MLKDERNADLQGTALKTAKQPAANPKEGFMRRPKAEAGTLAEAKQAVTFLVRLRRAMIWCSHIWMET